MNFRKFTSNGKNIYVNMDNINLAVPSDDGKQVQLFSKDSAASTVVPLAEFEAAISQKDDSVSRLTSMVPRLIDALNRLTVHIPSSIRIHM